MNSRGNTAVCEKERLDVWFRITSLRNRTNTRGGGKEYDMSVDIEALIRDYESAVCKIIVYCVAELL